MLRHLLLCGLAELVLTAGDYWTLDSNGHQQTGEQRGILGLVIMLIFPNKSEKPSRSILGSIYLLSLSLREGLYCLERAEESKLLVYLSQKVED